MIEQKLQSGDRAPDFEAKTDSGETVTLSDYRGQKVVLYFYPKDNTPGCTTQACGFRDSYPVIEQQDAVVLGISPDTAESHRKFKEAFDLPFTLLVDEDHEIADKYGVWGEKQLYGNTYMGNIRSHFVIDEEGTIIDAQVDISPKDSVKQAVKTLENA